jgi:tyrosinase
VWLQGCSACKSIESSEHIAASNGYLTDQQYWNWFAHQDNINKSPVYDGSETSMGGTGSYLEHEGSWAATGNVLFAPGKGGGCVQTGPFTESVSHLQLHLLTY